MTLFGGDRDFHEEVVNNPLEYIEYDDILKRLNFYHKFVDQMNEMDSHISAEQYRTAGLYNIVKYGSEEIMRHSATTRTNGGIQYIQSCNV